MLSVQSKILFMLGSKCSECNACVQICNHEAIRLEENFEGFSYPAINPKKCINCNLCIKVCPMINSEKIKSPNKQTFAVQIKDKDLLLKSSSGGVFSLIAMYTIKNNGIVYGAAWNKDMNLQHVGIEKIEELEKLRGSKYVHSEIGNSFIEIKKYLKQGRLVYFTGTPCQVAALKLYLYLPYKNLITSDLICHGTPSQKIFNLFKDDLENELNGRIIDYKFRDKKIQGWNCSSSSVITENRNNKKYHIYNKNMYAYYKAFIKGDITREDCYNCPFTTCERVGDITLADFWDIQKFHSEFKNLENGVSLVLINTEIGEYIWNKIKSETHYIESSIDIATKTSNKNLYSPTIRPSSRDKAFLIAFNNFNKFRDTYLGKENIYTFYVSYYKRRIKNYMKWILKRKEK